MIYIDAKVDVDDTSMDASTTSIAQDEAAKALAQPKSHRMSSAQRAEHRRSSVKNAKKENEEEIVSAAAAIKEAPSSSATDPKVSVPSSNRILSEVMRLKYTIPLGE